MWHIHGRKRPEHLAAQEKLSKQSLRSFQKRSAILCWGSIHFAFTMKKEYEFTYDMYADTYA